VQDTFGNEVVAIDEYDKLQVTKVINVHTMHMHALWQIH